MMHGVSHEYVVKRKVPRPEFEHKQHAIDRILAEKRYLGETFGVEINSFVPPGNYLSPGSYKQLEAIFPILFNVPSLTRASRPWTVGNIWWYAKRVVCQFSGLDFPHRQRKEGIDLASIDLSPATDFKQLYQSLEHYIYSDKKYLVVLATHYWEISGVTVNGGSMAREFLEFAMRLKENGVNFLNVQKIFLGGCINEKYSNIRIF